MLSVSVLIPLKHIDKSTEKLCGNGETNQTAENRCHFAGKIDWMIEWSIERLNEWIIDWLFQLVESL